MEVGQNISMGQQLMSIVALDDIWVTANFKETQLKDMRLGQAVSIEVDANGRTYSGKWSESEARAVRSLVCFPRKMRPGTMFAWCNACRCGFRSILGRTRIMLCGREFQPTPKSKFIKSMTSAVARALLRAASALVPTLTG